MNDLISDIDFRTRNSVCINPYNYDLTVIDSERFYKLNNHRANDSYRKTKLLDKWE